jgi:hypothetical protein
MYETQLYASNWRWVLTVAQREIDVDVLGLADILLQEIVMGPLSTVDIPFLDIRGHRGRSIKKRPARRLGPITKERVTNLTRDDG